MYVVRVWEHWQLEIHAKSCNTQLSVQVESDSAVCACMCLSGCKCEKIQNCFCWQSSKFSNNLRSNSLKPSGKKVFFLKMNYIPDSKRSWNALQNKSTTECCLSFDIYLIENSTKTICFRFLGFFGSTCLF